MKIRLFDESDAITVSELIRETIRISNTKDYQKELMDALIAVQTPEHVLEQDEYFLRAKRIEIPASITGVPFYLKMGYHYKDGISVPDEEHLIRMEKNR